MSHRTWMAFYTADFLAKTMHLCPKQAGAYVFLICHYWNHDGLPSNASQLARIARLTPEEWAEHEPVLKSFFHDGWKHERIDEELAIAEEKHRKRVESGTHGGKQKASNARVLLEQKPSNALPTTTTTTTTEEEESKSKPGKRVLPDDWAISNSHYELGERLGLSKGEIEEASEEMRAWSLGNGEKRANWDYVLNNWLRRNAKKGNRNGKTSGNIIQAADRLIERLAAFGPDEVRGGEGENVVRLIPKGGSE